MPAPTAGYSGTPLPKKLGIKPGSRVLLVKAPEGFEALLEPLPEGAVLRRGNAGKADLTVWFVTRQRDLEARVATFGKDAAASGLWIAWPKKASGVPTDVTEDTIRAAALPCGLVDIKVCAIDATWSGLRLAVRKAERKPSH